MGQQSEERAIDPQLPLQVDLLAPLDVSRLKASDRVFVRSRSEWQSGSCRTRAGSTIAGRVVEAEPHSKTAAGSKLVILFDTVSCDDKPSHLLLNIFAIIVDPDVHNGIGLADYGTFGAASNQPHMGGGSGPRGGSTAAAPIDRSQDMAVQQLGTSLKLPSVIQAGQVFGKKHLELAVGTGAEGGSILSTPKGNLRLETGAQFVLMPKPVPSLKPTAAAAVASSLEPAPTAKTGDSAKPPESPAPSVQPDETEVCTTSCSVVSSSGPVPSVNSAGATLSATDFGYGPHTNGRYRMLTYEASLSYLDDDNLLFTFDLRALRHRYADGIRLGSMKTVRAVLIDSSTHATKRIRDWQVQGDRRYIWPIANGRALVHIGQTLYLMNANLDSIRSVPVPGELVFVSVSPEGDRIAVGTLHERHTAELHGQLADAIQGEPEEDVDIKVFDDNFRLLSTSYRSTALAAPALTENGELRLRYIDHHQWRISEYRLDRTEHPVATIRSVCRPDITTPLPDTLFIVGCNASPLQNWYRVMGTGGHTILYDRGSSHEIQQSALASGEKAFTVRVVQTGESKANGDFFFNKDLVVQKISVYSATDGRRTFETNARPSLSEQSFATSPSGAQLAVLAGNSIDIYTMPVAR